MRLPFVAFPGSFWAQSIIRRAMWVVRRKIVRNAPTGRDALPAEAGQFMLGVYGVARQGMRVRHIRSRFSVLSRTWAAVHLHWRALMAVRSADEHDAAEAERGLAQLMRRRRPVGAPARVWRHVGRRLGHACVRAAVVAARERSAHARRHDALAHLRDRRAIRRQPSRRGRRNPARTRRRRPHGAAPA